MAKPKDLNAYAQQWESLALQMLAEPTGIIPIEASFTRKEALDVRHTFYGYRRALKFATQDATRSDTRRRELATFYRATMAFQCHIDPNPNDRNNDHHIFTMKFVRQAATSSMRKFFNALPSTPTPTPTFSPSEDERASPAQAGIDAYFDSIKPKDE